MLRSLGFGLAVALVAGAPAALADVHDFPSSDSTVVGSLGFIDDHQVGFFWTSTRGDSVEEVFSDPAPSISTVKWEYDVVSNGLRESLAWQMLINGTTVGKFIVEPGDLGPQVVEFDFSPVAAIGGNYRVRVEATSIVSPGAGAHTLRYALAGPHQITLGDGGGSTCYADCDESGSLDFFDFLCFQTAFAGGERYADCDESGSLDFFDFLCYQNAFAEGCGGGGELEMIDLGLEAPPSLMCRAAMTPFPVDARPVFTDVTNVPSPLGGQLDFSTACNVRQIGSGWATWSHGYTGSVYYSNGASSLDIGVPANSAFYMYIEPNAFQLCTFDITGAGGGAEVSRTGEMIHGSSGALGYGFCGGVEKINVTCTADPGGLFDFSVGEFGIAN